MRASHSVDRVPASLDEVLITAELARRPTRTPDYAAEGRALTALAEVMAESPEAILQRLVQTTLETCRADSAGISILESGGTPEMFRWPAIAGLFANHVGGGIPRSASPGGVVLDRNASQLFAYPERYFDYGMKIDPPIVEALFVPFQTEGKPVGILWVIAHTPSRQFDGEDQRLLTSLSRFAAVAYQMKTALLVTDAGLKAKADEVRQILDTSATGITRCSRDRRYLSVNAAYAKLVGLPTSQIIGRPIVDVMGTKAFEVIRPHVERVLRGERVEYEAEVPFAAGGPRFIHVVGTPWIDSDGQVDGWVASVSEITDLRRTTKALRESEERLRLAMSSGTIGVWDWDVSRGKVTWSPELGEIFGVAAESLRTSEDFYSLVHPDDLAAMESERDAAIRNHAQFDLEFRIVRPSGEIRWLSARGRGYYDETGNVVRVVGNNIDITERMQAKEALQEREQRLRFALNASRAGSWMRDARTGRVEFDDRFREIYGFTREEPASLEAWLSRVHGEDRQQVFELLDQIQHTKTQDTFDSTYHIVRPDGTMSWVESLGQVHRDAEGQLMRLTGLELDITERRRAEEALKEREQRLRLALDASMAGVWTWDPFTNQCYWDDRFNAQYGFAEGAPQTFDTWISSVHEEDRPRVLDHLNDVLRRYQNEWNIVFRAVRPDETVRWMHGLGRTDRAPDGQVTKMSGINLDITERHRAEELLQARRDEERERTLHRQAEEALRRSHAELEQSHAELERSHAELEQRTLQLRRLASQLTLAEQTARRQLASTLHDGLQQLLFSVGITLDEAMKTNSPDDQVELLRAARAEVKEAVEAARTLSVNLFPPVLHLGGLPAALTWLARRTQEQYSVAVNVTADPRANPEKSDVRILLFEAVRELLFNAVKHARVDRIDVHLALGPSDAIHIQVIDDGVGFDPSATFHDKSQPQVGLGLFSIQERLALLGGHLDIQSAPGKGSRFVLTLSRTGLRRLASDDAEARHHDTAWLERLAYDSASDRSKSLRILIADDHPVSRTGLRELFSRRPTLQVVGEAANGVEAITQALALQPDVVLMDVSMPEMNGIEATREIHGTLPHIQIVGFSTHDDQNTEGLIREAGAQAYFTKNEGTGRLLDYLLSLTTQVKPASAG
jgi:PAS domain S-box-containing protein